MNTEPAPHITTLRAELLATLRDLRNREAPMEPDRARAIAQVASLLVDSAKVEVDYIKATGQDRAGFLEAPPDALPGPTEPERPSAHNPFPSRVHRLEG